MLRFLMIVIPMATFLLGCASWQFSPERTSRFVDESGNFVSVGYAHEEYETTFTAPNGAQLPFKANVKVLVVLPDGTEFTGYRHMSMIGNLYKSRDEKWEYLEEGTGCAIAERDRDGNGYLLRYQGVLCGQTRSKKLEDAKRRANTRSISGSSTPQGFGRDSSGPRDSQGPRTVE